MGEEISMFLLDIIKNACLVPVNDQILVFKRGSDTKRSCKNFEVMILESFHLQENNGNQSRLLLRNLSDDIPTLHPSFLDFLLKSIQI